MVIFRFGGICGKGFSVSNQVNLVPLHIELLPQGQVGIAGRETRDRFSLISQCRHSLVSADGCLYHTFEDTAIGLAIYITPRRTRCADL